MKNDAEKAKACLAQKNADQRNGQLEAKQTQRKVAAMHTTADQVLDKLQPKIGTAQAFIRNRWFSNLLSIIAHE